MNLNLLKLNNSWNSVTIIWEIIKEKEKTKQEIAAPHNKRISKNTDNIQI